MSAPNDRPLHILFFPFLARGHLIPMADMAALFASQGARCTILTTPVNAGIIRSAVDRANGGSDCPAIHISVVPFPDVGLPPGVENCMALTSQSDRDKFDQAVKQLREPLGRFLAEHHPDAVVSDSFLYWSTDVAAEHGVPRLTFLGSSMFAQSCSDTMLRNKPLETAPDDPDALVSLPGLPHRVEMMRRQMMDPGNRPEHWAQLQRISDADQRSFGEVINSFHQLEPDYAEHYRTTVGRRAWLVGPVALASKDMAGRGTSAPSLDAQSCLPWLDTKQPGSVVYVSFGTLTTLSSASLHQLARGLHLSGKNFLWVVGRAGAGDSSEWMPEGFAELMARGDRGFIIRGWAPQMLVLNHPAIAGFVTHCGWNSALEAVSAGVPMLTWPRYADQFYNEKLIVEVLKVGVSIGAKDFASPIQTNEVIAGEVIAQQIGRLMDSSDEGDAIRNKAKDLGVAARSAVENGGSSYNDVGRLMYELMARRRSHLHNFK